MSRAGDGRTPFGETGTAVLYNSDGRVDETRADGRYAGWAPNGERGGAGLVEGDPTLASSLGRS